jgi:phytanoyl-CoA dioxygenase PhyH
LSVIGALRTLNKNLGRPARFLGPVRALIEPRARLRQFERDRQARLRRYREAGFRFEAQPDVADRIERDGYAVIPQAVDASVLLRIRQEVEGHLDAGTSLLPVAKDSARREGDRAAATAFLTAEETRRGQAYLREHTNYVSIAEVLMACPTVAQVAFHPLLIDIAWSYLGCVPALGGFNLRKSYANGLPEFDTLYFHVDPNSPRFLKFFFYLNDVDLEGGPFAYVRGSHRQRFPGWKRKVRWTPSEIEAVYGHDRLVPLTARLGDLVVADTNGFHRGMKVVSTDRAMLTIDYVVHEELEGAADGSQLSMRRADHEVLGPRERAVADFLRVV